MSDGDILSELDSIWRDDRLGRRADAEFLINFFLGRVSERANAGGKRSYVMNVDAGWGRGKSFFLQKLGETLDAEGYLVAPVNAWRDDHAEDPLLAVMAAIDQAVSTQLKSKKDTKRAWAAIRSRGVTIGLKAVRSAGLTFLKNKIGLTIDELIASSPAASGQGQGRDLEAALDASSEAIKSEIESITDKLADAAIDEFNRTRASIDTFRRSLEAFLSDLTDANPRSPIFVLIDELDRCRPPYAIAMLERIKHLFDIDNVIFIVATDGEQLSHAMAAVYGENFDAVGYLRRFFDRKYTFQPTTILQFVDTLMKAAPLDREKLRCPQKLSLQEFCASTFDHFALSLRDVEQCYDLLRSVATVWSYPVPIQVSIMLPVVIGIQMGVRLDGPRQWHEQLSLFAASQRQRTGRDPAKLTITVWNGNSGKPTSVEPLHWLQLRASQGAHQLSALATADFSDGGDFREAFRLEVEMLYDGNGDSARGRQSIVDQYSEMARSVGRLAEYKVPERASSSSGWR